MICLLGALEKLFLVISCLNCPDGVFHAEFIKKVGATDPVKRFPMGCSEYLLSLPQNIGNYS